MCGYFTLLYFCLHIAIFLPLFCKKQKDSKTIAKGKQNNSKRNMLHRLSTIMEDHLTKTYKLD